jgi:hypothetical protein
VTRRRIALFLALTALTGCGSAGKAETDEVRGVVQRFYAALKTGDAEAACRELSEHAIEQLQSQSGQTCNAVIGRLDLQGGPVDSADVFITGAIVRLGGGEMEFLGRDPGGWKLDAIGCQPAPGKPRDRPADCELES